MDVRRPALDGIDQDLLDVLDDRGVVDLDGAGGVGFRLGDGFGEFGADVFRDQARERRVARLQQLGDDVAELGVLDDDRVDHQTGLELDLVVGRAVRRVREGHAQPVAALHEGQDPAGGDHLVIDDLPGEEFGVERRQVEQRETEGRGRELGDLALGQSPARDQLLDETHAGSRCGTLNGFGVLFGQPAFLDEGSCEPREIALDMRCHAVAEFVSGSGWSRQDE